NSSTTPSPRNGNRSDSQHSECKTSPTWPSSSENCSTPESPATSPPTNDHDRSGTPTANTFGNGKTPTRRSSQATPRSSQKLSTSKYSGQHCGSRTRAASSPDGQPKACATPE